MIVMPHFAYLNEGVNMLRSYYARLARRFADDVLRAPMNPAQCQHQQLGAQSPVDRRLSMRFVVHLPT